MKHIIFFSFLFILSFNKSFAQDSIKFQRNDDKKELTVPLRQEIGIITTKDGEHRRIIITSYNDSTMTLRNFNYSLKERRKKREELQPIFNDTSISWEQKDSIELCIRYSREEIIKIDSIKKMKIGYPFVTSLNKQTNILGWIGLGAFVATLGMISIDNPELAMTFQIIMLSSTIYMIIVDHKTINFKKWHIKQYS